MITADGVNELWIRHDRQKSRMSIAEIRAAVTATEDLQVKVDNFVRNRLEMLRPLGFALAITGTPLSLEEGRVDIGGEPLRRLLREPPTGRPGAGVALAGRLSQLRPTLRGVAAATEGAQQQLEVFRNGHVEFAVFSRDQLSEVRGRDHILVSWIHGEEHKGRGCRKLVDATTSPP